MNETWAIAIFGAVVTVLTAAVGGLIVVIFQLSGRIYRLETSIEFLADAQGRMIAKKLHSPDNHLGLDVLLDEYINHGHDMTMEQWQMLKDKCLESRTNDKATKDEKAYAEFLIELCEHKMTPKYSKKLTQEESALV